MSYKAQLDRISEAKIKLILNGSQAFLSTLVLNLDTEIDTTIPTAATDGLIIKYNPSFIDALDRDELIFLVAHEAWHVAFLHMCRRGNRDDYTWNCAADFVINLMLKEQGFKLIKGGLCDSKYKNMSAEEVYDDLIKNGAPKSNPQDGDFQESSGDGDDEGQSSGNQDGEGQGSPSKFGTKSAEEVQQKIEDNIIKAATAAQMQNQAGSIPGHVSKMIDDILNPQLPWQTILSNYMQARAKTEKSWSRRNKRFRTTYLPGRLGESMGNVNIYVDASGSVSQDEFTAYISEMHDIRESLKPEIMKVISFDTQIKEEFIMEKGEEIDVNFTGGGGTCIRPVVDHAAEEDEVAVTIIFTDGYFSDADYTKIPNDVLFVIVNNKGWTCKDPNATVIHMEYKGNYG